MKLAHRSAILWIIILLCSCGTNQLFMNVQTPAPVSLPNTVKKVGIVNRSIPSNPNNGINAIHQIFSAESMAMVREGSAECIRGLKDALQENQRFEQITTLESTAINNEVLGIMASPLSWDVVDNLCNQNGLDALFVLEMYDTELNVTPNAAPPADKKDPLQILKTTTDVTISTNVKDGWRIYVPSTRYIADEYANGKTMNFNSAGNPIGAIDAMVQRKEYVKQCSNASGHEYAGRILPHWYRVHRDYFVKGGSNNFKIAKRMAQAGNWDGAAEYWQKDVNNPKAKAAGRACYNMAISNEINGKLDEALTWAHKAYQVYNVKQALHYINVLNRRKQDQAVLDAQQK